MPEEVRPLAIYSVAQAAELIHSDRRAIKAAIDEGSLRSFMPNGCTRGLRILGQWLLDWIEEGATGGK